MRTEDHNLRCNKKQMEKTLPNKERFGFVGMVKRDDAIKMENMSCSNKTASEGSV